MDKKLIFVIGSGRSGTHLIGRIIGSHPEVDAYIEDERTFTLVTKIATQQVKRGKVNKLIKTYKKVFSKSEYPIILEKSHPNIWLVEELLEAFPDAKFVGIYRDVYSTVSSMLKHEGVSQWFKVLPQNEVNPFLGITKENVSDYIKFSIEEKSALRWLSHKEQLEYLAEKYPLSVMNIYYNDLLTDQTEWLTKLSHFLDLSNSFSPEKFNLQSLTKWKQNLSEDQIQLIDRILDKTNG